MHQIYADSDELERILERERILEQEQNAWFIQDSLQCEQEDNEIDKKEEQEDSRIIGN